MSSKISITQENAESNKELAKLNATSTTIDDPPCHIRKLSPEILLLLINHLGAVESTCFGLTCKDFYAIHRTKYGKVGLHQDTHPRLGNSEYHAEGHILANFLNSWVPTGLVYHYKKQKYVPQEKFEEFMAETREDEEAQCYADLGCTYPGLTADDHDEIVERWMGEADELGWEYEIRPVMPEPTRRQLRRSKKWKKNNRG